MANPQLTVEIGANISSLTNSLQQSTRSVNQFSLATGRSLSGLDRNFTQLANTASSASNSLSRSLAQAAAASANSGRSISNGANQASFALTNLGRVAQDAPFGFIGIANNLNPLLESFQRLRAETGSNSAALRALGGSLLGPAGLGVALSLITAAVTFAQIGFRAWTGSVKNAKEASKEYAESLEAVRAAQLKGSQNAVRELTDLKLLYGAYQNANLPLKTRREAYNQLQEQYPNYFKNLSFEKTATQATATAYNELTNAILANAQAEAARDRIVKNSSRQLENREKILDLEKEQLKNQKELDKASRERNRDNANLTSVGVSTNTRSEYDYAKAQVAVNKNIKERQDLVTDTNLLNDENNRLLDFAAGKQEQILKLTSKTREETEKILNSNTLAQSVGGGITASTGLNPQAQLKIPDFKPPVGLTEYEKLINKAEESNNRFIESINNLANATLSSGIGDAFASIGSALAEGTNAIEAFGTAIISAFASFLSQLGQMFIKEGIAQIGYGIAKNLILPGSGANNIAGGAGMIAAGGLISAVGGAVGAKGRGRSSTQNNTPIRQFATGGYNLSAGMALVGERGPEFVDLPTGSSVHNNAKTNRILQGSGKQAIVLGGELDISLEKLYFALKQTEKNLNR